MIFRDVSRRLAAPVVESSSEEFCPVTVSSVVQSLVLVDDCIEQRGGVSAFFHLLSGQLDDKLLTSPESPFFCPVFDSPNLHSSLAHWPCLRKLSLASSTPWVLHGLRWDTLKAMMSLPQLEEFSLHGLTFSPILATDATPEELEVPSLDHLTSFRYEAPSFRVSSWGTRESYPFPSEETMLRRVLEKLHLSVERLTLSSEAAPIDAMAQWEWPRLRELTLTGERWAEPRTPLLSLFSSMPYLRKLALDLSVVRGYLADPPPLWPCGHRAAFPWPDLTHLSLSNPHAEDEVFAHLPPALQSLSLCCCPHKSEKLLLDGIATIPHRYKYLVLDSSGMLGILSRCRTPRLAHLKIEYNAGDREHDLLEHLTAAFPRLTSLQIHRYRNVGNAGPQNPPVTTSDRTIDDVDFQAVESFGKSLALLASLRTFNAYLDYEDTPRPKFDRPRVRGFQYSSQDIDRFTATLHKAADVLARAMGPSVESVQLWRPRELEGYEWLAFRVVRASGPAGVEARCEEDWRVSSR
ncbi:hypothetical protein GSI_09505 [Ganoderma sinense ZZ0214-1]|uniref:F-box domain-containing protein n=1 Tax=Ganoderma sinense ZZ0214-1 TaxID=1077348 RepID=A0A2G8S3P3_9APHY|nr:hypothetical protein GSI_09505 [Ganoderma sinense ZZ0214-1]